MGLFWLKVVKTTLIDLLRSPEDENTIQRSRSLSRCLHTLLLPFFGGILSTISNWMAKVKVPPTNAPVFSVMISAVVRDLMGQTGLAKD